LHSGKMLFGGEHKSTREHKPTEQQERQPRESSGIAVPPYFSVWLMLRESLHLIVLTPSVLD
jgi:hypothetical protein